MVLMANHGATYSLISVAVTLNICGL